MPGVPNRSKVLFLPVVRGGMYDHGLTHRSLANVRAAADALGVRGIYPTRDVGAEGLISQPAHVATYYERWRAELADVKALVVVSGDFMAERAVQDTVRLLPPDVPVFMMVNNDRPSEIAPANIGDSLCGSLSVHHNVRMLGRRIVRACRIDMMDADCVAGFFGRYARIIDGAEALRNMRVAMLGVNPDPFATTFVNQVKLFELGISIHTYELLGMWGDTVLARQLEPGQTKYSGPLGEIGMARAIAPDDARIPDVIAQLQDAVPGAPEDERRLDTIARCFLWIKDTFERDGIDAGAIHCWPEFGRFFGMAPCSVGMLANLLLKRPVVCEQDVCHAVMAALAWPMTGEPGVVWDVNNNGWEPRVFNVFHCSQTPTNWLSTPGRISNWGGVEGELQPVPFTGISAATTSSDFRAAVFHGQLLPGHVENRGTNGWAFVPNLPQVLKSIESFGIHHFVALKGHVGGEVADALRFRGLTVDDLAVDVAGLEELEGQLPPPDAEERRSCCVFSE